MNNNDKETYNSAVCVWCIHKNECTQNKFAVFVYKDRVSMRCPKYEYINKDKETILEK